LTYTGILTEQVKT